MKMTKVAFCIIVGLVSLAASNTMAVDIDYVPFNLQVHIANGEPKHMRCLDFNPPLYKGSNHDYDVPAELFPCSNNRVNQFWILSPEGYIRSSGNLCLIYDPYVNNPKTPATVRACDKSSVEAKKWKIWPEHGTITHVAMPRHVLTAPFAGPYSFVDVEQNTYASSQTWEFLYSN